MFGGRLGVFAAVSVVSMQDTVAFLASPQYRLDSSISPKGRAAPHTGRSSLRGHVTTGNHNPESITGSSSSNGSVMLAAVLCGVAVGLSAQKHAATKRRSQNEDGRMMPRLRAPMPRESSIDDSVESAVLEFVPRIAALSNQAESVRTNQVRKVIDSMEDLQKPQLVTMFKQVDRILSDLVEAISDMRHRSQDIHHTETGQAQLYGMGQGSTEMVRASPGDIVMSGEWFDVEIAMPEVHVIGLSHHHTPVEVREKCAVPEHEWNRFSREMIESSHTSNGFMVREAAVLSTCNRFEVYFLSSDLKKFKAQDHVLSFLQTKSGLTDEEMKTCFFSYSGKDAIQHLFEVSSGMDSLVLGEAQILSQVKACHERAIEKANPEDSSSVAGSGGKIISKMLNAGIRVGKLVRTETKIGKGAVSVSSAAVELWLAKSMMALKKYPQSTSVCIVGAGKMGRLLLIALFSKMPDVKVILVNRSVDKAQAILDEVANRGGKNAKVVGSDKMWEAIDESDVVFAATSSAEPIISAADLESRSKRLMLVDICVPRNIAADCSDVEGVHSFSVDDLKKIQQANNKKRQDAVLKAGRRIGSEVRNFKAWQASQAAVPFLASLQARVQQIMASEWQVMSRKLRHLSDNDKKNVMKLVRHVVDKLIRPTYYSLKEEEHNEMKRVKIWAMKSLLKLEPLHKRSGPETSPEQIV